jgi:hypothetical protein
LPTIQTREEKEMPEERTLADALQNLGKLIDEPIGDIPIKLIDEAISDIPIWGRDPNERLKALEVLKQIKDSPGKRFKVEETLVEAFCRAKRKRLRLT